MAIKYFVHRLITYPISETERITETSSSIYTRRKEYRTHYLNTTKSKIQRTL
jgi:hypothetical protein